MQDIMMNVYAFVLAFAAYELGQVELNLVGRRLKLALATPSDAGEEEGLLAAAVAAEESEFNARLRRALDTLVEEMIDVADADAGPDASAGGAATTRVGGAARQTKQKKNAFLKGVSGVFASFGGTADYDDEEEEEEGEERRPRDVDGVVYAVFLARHAPATDEFPFPHLTPEDFRAAVSDLLKALRPDRGRRRRPRGCGSKSIRRRGRQRRRRDSVGGVLFRGHGARGRDRRRRREERRSVMSDAFPGFRSFIFSHRIEK